MVNKNCTNNLLICGTVTSDVTLNHSYHEIDYYRFVLSTSRFSDHVDELVVIAPKNMIPPVNINGQRVKVDGSFRSYNSKDGSGKLFLFIYARSVELSEEEDMNFVSLSGYVCKKPIVRKTSKGTDIADLFLAINTGRNSSYVPLILWRDNAIAAKFINIGDFISVDGRLQSRPFIKVAEDGEIDARIAYEVSVKNLSIEVKENV